MLSFDEALEKLLAGAKPVTETKAMPTLAAAGRVLAEAQYSTLSVPPLDNSAMDGCAVRAADVAAVGMALPVSQLQLRPQSVRTCSRVPPYIFRRGADFLLAPMR